jgi:triosephosphate isomerase
MLETRIDTMESPLRAPLIAGNWKMHKTVAEARALAAEVVAATAERGGVDVLLAPPFTALATVAEAVAGHGVLVAAQDCHWADAGAFTGAISPPMVAELASHVILGHSERRAIFGDSDDEVNRKVHAALAHGLAPIVCIGESEAQRDAGDADAVVSAQLAAALAGVADAEATRLTVAYEPVWAIGTGRACDTDEAARVCALVRAVLAERFDDAAAATIRVLYGGSVKPNNIDGYMAAGDIDGALVGGASLTADSFAALVSAAAA